MGKKRANKGRDMATKPRELGYNGQQLVDAVLMADSQAMFHASAILTNDLTKEAIVREAGLIIKELAEIQRASTEIKYLGK